MPGRHYSSGNYRYGFNGKENDNDVKGVEGSQQDYGMRIYGPRIGRFLSVNPLTKKYSWYSPYHFAGNTPIQAIDLDAAEPALRQSIQGISKMRGGITAVSTSFTIESGFVVSMPRGMAVDGNGSVLCFLAWWSGCFEIRLFNECSYRCYGQCNIL